MPFSKEYFDAVLDYLNLPEYQDTSQRRIFLKRTPSRGRHLTNADEVEEICRRHGFEIIDTDGMSFEDQARTFSQARYVIGVHGAGLTNLLFRRNGKLKLLEIFTPDIIHPQYYWLCSILGFEYSAILGQLGSVRGVYAPLALDPKELEVSILSMLN